MKSICTKLICIFLFGGVLLGCQGGSKRAPGVFRVNMLTPVSALDPAFARSQSNNWACQAIFNTLLKLDDSLQLQPELASRWSISADGLAYTFVLRPGVQFADDPCFPTQKGRFLNAHDVVFSFSRILDTLVGSPGSWVFAGRVRAENPFMALNDSTFVMYLSQPFLPMLGILTMPYCSVVAPEAVKMYGASFREHPVGTGPFVAKRWDESEGLFLHRNTNYWEKDTKGVALPYLQAIRVSFIPDRKTAFLSLIQGQLDFSNGVDAGVVNRLVTPDGHLHPSNFGKIKLEKSPYLNTEYFGFQMDAQHPVAKNKSLRQAMNFGLDRKQLLYTLRNSLGYPAAAGFSPSGLASFDTNATPGYTYNNKKAAQLLAQAGFPGGKGLPPLLLYCQKDYLDVCTFAARQWADLGIPVQVELTEAATLREMMTQGKADFFRASWIADYPDAESFFTCFYSKNPAPPNYTHFKNKAFDLHYEQSLAETIPEKRLAHYHAMDNILIEEAPVVFLFYDVISRFTAPKVSGLSQSAMGAMGWQYIKL